MGNFLLRTFVHIDTYTFNKKAVKAKKKKSPSNFAQKEKPLNQSTIEKRPVAQTKPTNKKIIKQTAGRNNQRMSCFFNILLNTIFIFLSTTLTMVKIQESLDPF